MGSFGSCWVVRRMGDVFTHFWIAKREDPIILSVSALLRLGLMARASLGGNVSSLSSMLGWSEGTIIVPEDLREPRRGREERVALGWMGVSSASEVDVEVWLESVLEWVVKGSATEGTGASGLMVVVDVVSTWSEDMMGGLYVLKIS